MGVADFVVVIVSFVGDILVVGSVNVGMVTTLVLVLLVPLLL